MIDEDLKTYKLYISHIGRDDEEYKLFISKLDASYDFRWKDYAVKDRNSPDEIAEQIKPVDVVIILSGLLSKDEKLVNRQLDTALKQEKPIVVIRPYGMENVPPKLDQIASEVVGWNTPCIVDAILDSLNS